MSDRTSNRIFDIVNVSFITLFVIFCLAPFLHTIAISLSSNRAITSGEVTIFPKEFNWDAYGQVFSDHSMIYSLGFTTVLTIATTALCMLFTILCGVPAHEEKIKRSQNVYVRHHHHHVLQRRDYSRIFADS